MIAESTLSAQQTAANKSWNDYFRDSFHRDGKLFLITFLILICMNIPIIKYILYPFIIFSTWIHELCHGLAAILAGGRIDKILIYPDTSGLAVTAVSVNRRGFVASAGYQGTAVIGCLLLIFRRSKRGPRTLTIAIAFMMLLSSLLWIRNIFGLSFICLMGVILGGVAWKLPSNHMRSVYIVLAVTCAMNAITSVQDLFGSNQVVNGQSASTDAHTMAEIKGIPYIIWAITWLLLAIILTFVGILFAMPGPDEIADFQCCGFCQDLGCFKCCNYEGQILSSRSGSNTNDVENIEGVNSSMGMNRPKIVVAPMKNNVEDFKY